MGVPGPLLALGRAVRSFELGEIAIVDLQSSIVANGSALDGAPPELLDALRGVGADSQVDTAYLYLSDAVPHGTVVRAVECGPVVLDFDRPDRLVGIEARSASENLALPNED